MKSSPWLKEKEVETKVKRELQTNLVTAQQERGHKLSEFKFKNSRS